MLMNNLAKPLPEPARRLTPKEEGRFLLAQHLRRLVDADPEAARWALEMAQEGLPEMYQIAQDQPAKYWAEAVMSSDSMHSLMARDRSPKEQEELMQSLLQTEDLQSLLERLP
jgi:hypothetical protein